MKFESFVLHVIYFLGPFDNRQVSISVCHNVLGTCKLYLTILMHVTAEYNNMYVFVYIMYNICIAKN